MTNKNLSLKTKPFLLKPAGKNYLWGGNRLNDDFSKGIDMEPLAETWECSTHPDGPSSIVTGEHKGRLLSDVLREHPEYLGTYSATNGELPILIKLIDAKKDLSVQVHPNDEYAKINEKGSLGKTEMWYVLDALKDTSLVYGFHRNMDKETVRKSIKDGTLEKYLQKIKVEKDDVFYIESGKVHAIGAGALIAEIQQCSNITYRLYDYNRLDKNGKTRQLHIDKALDVADLTGGVELRQPLRILKYAKGCASEVLCRCKYFQVERQLINTERFRQMADYRTGSHTFEVLLCIGGCGVMFDKDREFINFFKGDCIFIPANSVGLKIHGKAQLLKVSC